MEFEDFVKLLGRKKQTIITIVLVATMMTVLLSLLSPLKYEVKSRLLVSQDSGSSDVYALSRSNEYLGKLLSEIVYSGSFYDRVLNSNYSIDKNYFSGDYSKQMKRWEKTISSKTKQDTGIIEISIYHPNVSEAKKIALAVNNIIINNNKDYHGGASAKINIIDQPLASDYPTKPNILFNATAAFGLAFLFSLFFVYIFPEDKYTIYLFGSSSSKKKGKNKRKIAEINYSQELDLDNDRKVKEIKAENEHKEDNKDDDAVSSDDIDLSGNISNLIG